MHRIAAKPKSFASPRTESGKGVGARERWPRCLRIGVLVLGLGGLPAAQPFLRGGDVPGPGANPSTSPRDMVLAVHVRRALLDDPALGPLNLGVKVRDGVVVLLGPVPTAALAQQAIRKVSEVRGVWQVRSELYLSRNANREPIALPLTDEAPTRTESASPDPISGGPGTLTGRAPPGDPPSSGPSSPLSPPGRGAESEGSSSLPIPEPRSAPLRPAPKREAGAAEEAREWGTTPTTGSGVSLLAPVLDGPQTAGPPAAAGLLASAVERVRRSDPRFRGIRVEVRGATVLLSGPDVPGENVMALAQALSVLPGVERVRLQNSSSTQR
jgi:hypothetical protein